MKYVIIIYSILFGNGIIAQNIGIGTTTPVETLDVNGNIKVNGLTINNGGSQYDFLMKSNAAGMVGFKKGHGGMGMRYIICVQGCPVPSSTILQDGPFLSEIKIFAGNFAPTGWMFCEGQFLNTTSYASLYSLLGFTYGGSGTTFGIPDLRGAVPVGPGASTAGYTWTSGQKTN